MTLTATARALAGIPQATAALTRRGTPEASGAPARVSSMRQGVTV